MNKNRHKIVYLIMLSVLMMGCEKPTEPPIPPRPALVTIVGKTDSQQGMVLVGEVKSRYESNQGFRINGKIIERKVDVGAYVKKGQIIARLDASDTSLSSAAAYADVRAAEASHALASAEVARQRTLFGKKFISQSALDLREAELKTSSARLSQVKAQAAVSSNQSRYTALVADREGVVTQINAEPGQVVEAGNIIVQIVDTKQIEVLVAVPESRMADLKINDLVLIKLWADQAKNQEKSYQGKVREIAPAANSATRAFDVRVLVTNADEAVKLGMTAGVSFASDAQSSIIVPTTALTKINGSSSVWVVDKAGIVHPRKVQAGQFTEQGVLITSGLQPGEMIAIAGAHTLVKGQKVKPNVEVLP